MRFRATPVLLAVAAVVAVLGLQLAANTRAQRITAAFPGIQPRIEGAFKPNGQFPGEPLDMGVRSWGSWAGDDANQGRLEFGPFTAANAVHVAVGGYPKHSGIELYVELAGTGDRQPFTIDYDVGERWRVADATLPSRWMGHQVEIVAIDHASGAGGWIALTEPLVGTRGSRNNALYATLASWVLNLTVYGLVWWAALEIVTPRRWFPAEWAPLLAAAVVATSGYIAFWLYFGSHVVGQIFSWSLLIGAAGWLAARRPAKSVWEPDVRTVAHLIVAIGFFYVALLHLFPSSRDIYDLAANRFREQLPGDNTLPSNTAAALITGKPLRDPKADWLSSDRPPLQAGWQLLGLPASLRFGIDERTATCTAGILLQLLWVPAVYLMMWHLRVPRVRIAAWVILLSLSGFFLQNTVFTWPKLSAAAFGCAAFFIWVFPPGGGRRLRHYGFGAWFAGLAWLSHGGIAFSFVALLPWVAWRAIRGEWRHWLVAAGVVLLFALPWFGYQKLYDPPGDRLVKMHLAGVPQKDPRGSWTAITDAYRHASWKQIRQNKLANFEMQFLGNWRGMFNFTSADAAGRRDMEFFFTGRALTWWLLGLCTLPVALGFRTRRNQFGRIARTSGILAAWTVATVVVWCLLMFGGYTASIHQGSYATMLTLFVLLSAWLELVSPWMIVLVAFLQLNTFISTWAGGNGQVHGEPTGWPFLALTSCWLAAILVGHAWPGRDENPPTAGHTKPASSHPETRAGDGVTGVRRWLQGPFALWTAVFVSAALIVLHKTWALRTPQLWAEDGSIFLNDAEQFGARAFFRSYQGYLHLIPRLIVWVTGRLADVAAWPLYYNLGALLVACVVLARMTSPRLVLPHKFWLILAFGLIAQSGEVLLNITNVQWIAAFFLIQQLLIQAPRHPRQMVGDLILVTLAALTGPFAVMLLPLFAWRAWKEGGWQPWTIAGAVFACALIQLLFLVRNPGYSTAPAHGPFQFLGLLAVLGTRLVVWPFLGTHVATTMPMYLLVEIGTTVVGVIVVRTLIDSRRRECSLPVLLIIALLVVAAAWRARIDLWNPNDVGFGDRYFYVPRLLFAWLVIWQLDAPRRIWATLAAVACATAAMVELPTHAVPAPPDYHWRNHCDSIRRGVPAAIPTLPVGWIFNYAGRPHREPSK